MAKAINYFSSIGILYLILAVLSLLWSLDLIPYAQIDFLLIYSILLFIQTLILFRIFYLVSKNKILSFLLFFYLFSLFLLIYSYSYFFNFFVIISFFLTFIISTNLTLRNPNFKNTGIFGMVYSFGSLTFQLLALFLNWDPYLFIFISGLILLIIFHVFLKELKNNPLESEDIIKIQKKSYMLLFFKSFIFIIALANIIFIGTVFIHEFGHFSLSKIYSCEKVKIIYEGGSPYTEALCKSPLTQKVLLFGGFLPFLIAIFLFICGGKLMKNISILILGFNLVILYRDFAELGLSNNLIIFFILIGIVIIVTGIMILAKSSTEEYVNII